MAEFDPSESVWERGLRDTGRALHSPGFLFTDIFGGGLVGWFYNDPLAGLLVIALGVIILWIGAIAGAPLRQRNEARQQLKQSPHPLEIADHVHCESPSLREVGAKTASIPVLWENIFYLVVSSRELGRTIRNVSVHFHTIEGTERCPVRGSESFVSDVRHGEWVYFRLGRVISTESSGLPRGPDAPVTKEEMMAYVHNAPKGCLSFEPAKASNTPRYNAGMDTERTKRAIWEFPIIVTADDLPARSIGISVDMRTQKVAVSIIKRFVEGVSFDNGAGSVAL